MRRFRRPSAGRRDSRTLILCVFNVHAYDGTFGDFLHGRLQQADRAPVFADIGIFVRDLAAAGRAHAASAGRPQRDLLGVQRRGDLSVDAGAHEIAQLRRRVAHRPVQAVGLNAPPQHILRHLRGDHRRDAYVQHDARVVPDQPGVLIQGAPYAGNDRAVRLIDAAGHAGNVHRVLRRLRRAGYVHHRHQAKLVLWRHDPVPAVGLGNDGQDIPDRGALVGRRDLIGRAGPDHRARVERQPQQCGHEPGEAPHVAGGRGVEAYPVAACGGDERAAFRRPEHILQHRLALSLQQRVVALQRQQPRHRVPRPAGDVERALGQPLRGGRPVVQPGLDHHLRRPGNAARAPDHQRQRSRRHVADAQALLHRRPDDHRREDIGVHCPRDHRPGLQRRAGGEEVAPGLRCCLHGVSLLSVARLRE